MKNIIPQIPESISGNGEEIWDWAGKLSRKVFLTSKARELRASIKERGCGDCELWMTKQCPREKPNNITGRSSGPSMSATVCSSFKEKAWVAELRAQRQKELLSIETEVAA